MDPCGIPVTILIGCESNNFCNNGPFLWTGVTLDIFQSCGNIPVVINILVKEITIKEAANFTSFADKLSRPVALDVDKPNNRVRTSC